MTMQCIVILALENVVKNGFDGCKHLVCRPQQVEQARAGNRIFNLKQDRPRRQSQSQGRPRAARQPRQHQPPLERQQMAAHSVPRPSTTSRSILTGDILIES